MSFLLKQNGYIVSKDGKIVSAKSDDCNCCGEPEPPVDCAECDFCSGCLVEHRPGCPTGICCTPHKIRVVVSGVDAAASNCAADTAMGNSVKITNLPTVDGTFTLIQNPLSACSWFYSVAASHTYGIHSGLVCAGSPYYTENKTNPLQYFLSRGNLGWTFGISQGHIWMFGKDTGGCTQIVQSVAEDVDQACDTVPTMSNALVICMNNASGFQTAFSNGGTATFTVCP